MLLFIRHNKKGRAKMARFLYSAFSDEAADSIDGQIAACKANGVTHMELRGVDGKNISEFTVDEAKALKEKLDANGMKVSSIGSYYGKIEITDDFEPHFEGFKNTVEVAKILEAKYIRLFSFYFTKGESYEEYRPEVMRRVRAMAEYSKEALFLAIQMIDKYDKQAAEKVIELENAVDHYEDEIGTYLVKLSSRHLTEKDSQQLSVLLHSIGDFERISDHAINIMESAREMYEKELSFSKKAQEELAIYTGAIKDIVSTSVLVFQEEDLKLAAMIEPLEEVIDGLSVEVKKRHMKRLRKGKCTIEMGFILSDITTNYEMVSDHCSNIALSLLQLNEENFDTHEYQETISSKDNVAFTSEVEHLKERYQLP